MNTHKLLGVVMMLVLSLLALTGLASADNGTEGDQSTERIILRFPDIAVTSVHYQADNLKVHIKVKNLSKTTATGKFVVGVSVRNEGMRYYEFQNLAPGQEGAWYRQLNAPLTCNGNLNNVRVTADFYNAVLETNENNNVWNMFGCS